MILLSSKNLAIWVVDQRLKVVSNRFCIKIRYLQFSITLSAF